VQQYQSMDEGIQADYIAEEPHINAAALLWSLE
jgi:hypothetical protein